MLRTLALPLAGIALSLAVPASAQTYGVVKPFTIKKMYEGPKFVRCVADYGNPALLRIAWFAADRSYWVSIPGANYQGGPPAMLISIDGRPPLRVASNGDAQRPGAKLPPNVVDAFLGARQSIAIQYANARYLWNIAGTDMTNVFTTMENCVFSVIRP
ncbi:MAG: hypothetical protein WDN24_12435 [Sphingomonas sp.]